MPNDSKLKEYVKIGGIVGGIVLSSTSLVNQHNDTSTYEVRMKALEMHVESYGNHCEDEKWLQVFAKHDKPVGYNVID